MLSRDHTRRRGSRSSEGGQHNVDDVEICSSTYLCIAHGLGNEDDTNSHTGDQIASKPAQVLFGSAMCDNDRTRNSLYLEIQLKIGNRRLT